MRIARLFAAAVAIPGCCVAQDIPQATHLTFSVLNHVSTRTARVGDVVYLRTINPVAVAGRTLVPAGSNATAQVIGSKRSKRIRGRAELILRIEELTLPTGAVVKASPRLVAVTPDNQRILGAQGTLQQKPPASPPDPIHFFKHFAVGYLAGMLTVRLADKAGASVEDAVTAGAYTGIGVGIGSAILERGCEVEIGPGTTIDTVFESPIPLAVP